MTRMRLGAAVVLALATAAGSSFAGSRLFQTPWVVANGDGSGSFYGNFYGANSSSDNTAEIGCTFGGTGTNVTCWATDPAGNTGQCSTTSTNLVTAARLLDSSSTLYVVYNSSGACTTISVSKSSASLPQ